MKIEIHANPIFHLPLTGDHVHALIALSERHYDWKCKDAATGFLSEWRKLIAVNEELGVTRGIIATRDQLDTASKIMELRGVAHPNLIDDNALTLLNDLARSFHGAARLANEHYSDWQATYA